MFATIESIKSSAISGLSVNPMTNQAIVTYTSGSKYLYNNVSFESLLDLLCGEFDSLGKFVNAYCKGNNELKLA
tara:strand:- start:50 stop:271 length:222 start_codon:yes stop_codon:yes gene_type:complete